MARLTVESGYLLVNLGPWEKVGAFSGNLRVPLTAVREARVIGHVWRLLRGMRMPGTEIPGVISLGSWRGSFGRDFVAVYGRGAGIIVELADASTSRLLVSCPDPEAVAQQINEARGGGH